MFTRLPLPRHFLPSFLPSSLSLARGPLSLQFVRHEIKKQAPLPVLKAEVFQARAAERRAAEAAKMAAPPLPSLFVVHDHADHAFFKQTQDSNEQLEAKRQMGVYGQLNQIMNAGDESMANSDSIGSSSRPLPVPAFGVFLSRGGQYKVTQDDLVMIPKYPAEVGQKIVFNNVLLLGTPAFSVIGRPRIEYSQIEATVEEHLKTEKVLAFHKKRRKGHRKMKGHRSHMTTIRINRIVFPPQYEADYARVVAATEAKRKEWMEQKKKQQQQ